MKTVTVGYFDKNDTTICSYSIFLIRKNTVHVKLQPRMQALVTSRLGWRLKYLLWFYTWLAISSISASCELDKSLTSFSDAAIRPWEMHVLYNPDGIAKYSVIHRLRLINSAQLCNKKFQSTCWSRNAALFIAYAGAVVLISVILEISSMSLNSEASRVSFLNQTLLQIENHIKKWSTFLSMQCLDMF